MSIDGWHLSAAIGAVAWMAIDFALRRSRGVRGYRLPDTLCSLALGTGYFLVWMLARGLVLAAFVLASRVVAFDVIPEGPVGWLVTLIGVDLSYYVFHRAMHSANVLWAIHSVHHSSAYFNYATALRGSFVEPLLEPWFHAWLILMGADPLVLLGAMAVNHGYQFWVHTEAVDRLGALEWMLVTPSHHRVHHARNHHYLDRNFGGMLILWDRVFGTFTSEHEAPQYGLVAPIRSIRPWRVVSVPFERLVARIRHLPNPKAQLAYLIARPTHDSVTS